MLKPAEDTPLTAAALAELARRSGLPAGALNVLSGDAPAVGRARQAADAVRKLGFTGSTAVGKSLYEGCAPTMKRISLELGGNAPFVVFADADVDAAATAVAASGFRNAGQTCISASRVFVHVRQWNGEPAFIVCVWVGGLRARVGVPWRGVTAEACPAHHLPTTPHHPPTRLMNRQKSVHDDFVAALVARAARVRLGSGLDPGTTMGPLISAAARTRVAAHVEDAVARGAVLAHAGSTPGTAPYASGFFAPPAVLTGATADMRVYREETFGPVLAVFPFESEAEAATMANDTEYGLAAYVFTRASGRGGGGRGGWAERAAAHRQGGWASPAPRRPAHCPPRPAPTAQTSPQPFRPCLALPSPPPAPPTPLPQDLARAWTFSEALDYGMVGVNDVAITAENAPFGGVKHSGLGRESGKYGLAEFLDVKLVSMGVAYGGRGG